MTKSWLRNAGGLSAVVLLGACVACTAPLEETDPVSGIDLTHGTVVTTSKAACRPLGLELVKVGGKVRYFGLDILQNPPAPRALEGIPDVHVWLAEYPFTKLLNIRTDADGFWRLYLIKRKGEPLDLSFMYEKDHYPAAVEEAVFGAPLPDGWDQSLIKSNVHTVISEDIDDLAVQMPDEIFLYYAKSELEAGIGALIGAPYAIENLTVATVGKAWASIFDPALPHGDAGAIVTVDPAAPSPLSGPIYFDETVTPNPAITETSIDGGVLFNNLSPGSYTMTASKDPFEYDDVNFIIDPAVRLYVASPPHAIQGNNPSGPGEP